MTIKQRIITSFWVVLVVALFCVNYIYVQTPTNANSIYAVYLDGKTIGYILDDDELYDIINSKQNEIKSKYNVQNVYPPENFKIVKIKSYDTQISSAEDVYDKLAKMGKFTIEGYVVTVKANEKENVYINVLDKNVFDQAINNFVLAFVSSEQYNNYINDTQEAIDTTGKIIELMYFDETLTIKKGFISVSDTIYTDETLLTQYLLFGKDYKLDSYTVQSGDTIDSISENNKLNPQEFLVANPKYTSEDSLLTIGDEVNITLINPVLTFVYEVNEVADTTIPFEKKVEIDKNRPSSYSEITTPGSNGITRITTEYVVKNGETQSGVNITKQEVITEKIDQITTKGPSLSYSNVVSGTYVDDGSYWGWPTNYPYVLTSTFGYRWGTLHEGIDISGTGYGSPIYASLDGTVYYAGWGGKNGNGCGYGISIAHSNGYYTMYCHLSAVKVSAGQSVSRGQIIGSMGASGIATGTHLHFGLWKGIPYEAGSSLVNPLSLWK